MSAEVIRGRTALTRTELSRPVRLTIDNGLLGPAQSFFDYGCGLGGDLTRLAGEGFRCSGWDPAHRADAPHVHADVVNLGYVLNVIEDLREREHALTQAFALAQNLLVVAARTSAEARDLVFREPLADGVRTSRSTFQKFYEQHELKAWIEQVLGHEALAAGLGIFYVFRDDEAREEFRASRLSRRIAAPSLSLSEQRCAAHPELVETLMRFFLARGRLPLDAELPCATQLAAVFGTIKRAFGAIRRTNQAVNWEALAAQRREDLLLYLALSRFERGSRWSTLTAMHQADVRALFGSYAAARRQAEALLLAIGQQAPLARAFERASVGKLTQTALYVHRSALEQLPLLLRAFEGCARGYLGEIEGANIVKLYRYEPKISYLSYPAFSRDPHPTLAFSLNVDLREFRTKLRRYDEQPNPPVLHRKELFVSESFKGRAQFARLSEAEATAGLLDDSKRIGLKTGWTQALTEGGYVIKGHRLVKERDG